MTIETLVTVWCDECGAYTDGPTQDQVVRAARAGGWKIGKLACCPECRAAPTLAEALREEA